MLKKYPLVDYTNFRFEYTKNIGFTTIRSYSINYTNGGAYDLQKLEQLLEKLYNSEEYKKKNCNVIWNKELRRRYALLGAPTIQYMTYTGSISTPSSDDYYYYNNPSYTASDSVTLPATYAFLDGLCDALAKDILADEKYYVKCAGNNYSDDPSDFFGDSYLELNASYDRNRLYKDPIVGGYDPDSYVDDLFAIITSDYTNTLAYLEKNGIPTTFDPYSVPPTYDYPTDLIESSDAARNYYFSYGMNGDVNDIEGLANEISSTLLVAGCYRAGVEDLMDWEAKHGAEFRRILSEEAVKLHKEYIKKEENLSYEYTNSFLEREGMTNTGKYYKTADMIVAQLNSDCESIIRDLSKTSV